MTFDSCLTQCRFHLLSFFPWDHETDGAFLGVALSELICINSCGSGFENFWTSLILVLQYMLLDVCSCNAWQSLRSVTIWWGGTWLSLHLLIAYSLRFSLYLQDLGRCLFGVSSWTWQLSMCSLVLIVVLIGCLRPRRRKLLQKVRVKMRSSKSIILWSCQWAGMASQFLTGSTSSMDSARYLVSVNLQPPCHFCKSAVYAYLCSFS